MTGNDLKRLREFNRFFGVQLNVFDRYAFGTPYSLAEGRIVGEIGRNGTCTANDIAESLRMDKSYLSRILAKLEAGTIITRTRSDADSRKKFLRLTEKGHCLYTEFEVFSDTQAKAMLSGLETRDIAKILDCMRYIQTTLGKKHGKA